MAKKYEIHVVSNTHWDREWLSNYQETRYMLVEMIDKLLDILDNNSEYKSFLFDSQTVPVEDYLEVRPENRERIEKHVANKRLLLGPWYTDPETFIINGESLVRNLLIGHKVAHSFGGVMKVGYTPFGYGQNSQMPQLYKGFGIDTMLFYHGLSHDEVENEFIFEAADGSQVLASQISSGARYNFYHNVYRPVIKGKTSAERIYDWQQDGTSFRIANDESRYNHFSIIKEKSYFDEAVLEKSVKALFEAEKAVCTTNKLIFMSGHDSSIADEVELKLIESAKKYLDDAEIMHSSLPEVMAKIKEEAKDLRVLKGERRTPKLLNGRVHLYSDVVSSRSRMKYKNAIAEYKLQRQAEPFAVLANILGHDYPEKQFEIAWKTLLKCHAHDSIAGSGVDDIENDMMNRLQQVENITNSIIRRSLEYLQANIKIETDNNDVVVTVYNSSPTPRTEVITAVIEVPIEKKSGNYELEKINTKEIFPLQISSRKPNFVVVNHPREATLMMNTEQLIVRFEAKDIPAFGYTTYILKNAEDKNSKGLVCGSNAMENKHIHVHIESDGTLTIKNKKTGNVYSGLHYFEDSGEAGHAWMHIEPTMDEIITSHSQFVSVALMENGANQTTYRINYRMTIPSGIDGNGEDKWQRLDGISSSTKRSDATTEIEISSLITLKKDSKYVEVKTSFDNVSENHRLRVMFPTHLKNTNVCNVETPFDVVEREIEYTESSPWFGGTNATFPMQRFVDLSDGKNGLAIINKGLREYQVSDDAERTIGITLLRAYEINLTTVSYRWETHPEMKKSQSPGHHEFEYIIYPHESDWSEANVHGVAEVFTAPLIPIQAGVSDGEVSSDMSFLNIEPAGAQVSAFKLAEDNDGYILRLYNPKNSEIKCNINFGIEIKKVEIITMEELLIKELDVKNNSVKLSIGKKKIVSLRIRL